MGPLRDTHGRLVTNARETEPELSHGAGAHVMTESEIDAMRKAEERTTYWLNGMQHVINEGDPIPDGAELASERAKQAAPDNRAKKAAPQNRSAKSEKKDA